MAMADNFKVAAPGDGLAPVRWPPVVGGALRMPGKQMRTRWVQGGLAVVALVLAVAMSLFPTDDFVVDSASSHHASTFEPIQPEEGC